MPDKVSPAKERLPGSEWLGWGFDALMGQYSTASCRRRILPELPTGPDVFSYGGLTYAIPRGVAVSRGSGRGDAMMVGSTFVAASQLELQEHFAARANLKGTYGSFTGELEVLYGYEREREQSCWYALIEGRLEGFRMAAGDLTPSAAFLADPSVAALTALQNPAFDPSGPELFYRVFRRWGTHIVTQIAGGASLEYAATVDRSAASDKQIVSAKLDLEYKAVLGDSSLQAKVDWESLTKSWSASRQAKIATSGGTAGMMGVLAPTFNDNFSERYSDWLATLEQAPAVIDLRLQPLSAVFSNPQLAAEVQKAADAYLGNGIYVEASHRRENVAFVSVCGQTVPHDARQGSPAIAQLVVIDPKTLKVLVNNTTSQPNVPPDDAHQDWSRLLTGTEKLTGSGYFCAVAVSDFYVSSYPSPALADWLRGYGASLESWPTRPVGIPGDHRICYAFVGRQGLRPKDGLERTEVHTSASPSHDMFASACAPLIPLDGTFGLPRAE